MVEAGAGNQIQKRLWQLAYIALIGAGVWGGIHALNDFVFPWILWLGRPTFTLPLTVAIALFLVWIMRDAFTRFNPTYTAIVLTPLLLNLLPRSLTGIAPVYTWLATVWLTLLLAVAVFRPKAKRTTWLALLFGLLVPLLLLTLQRDFGSADTFEFQVTAPKMGIAHPTGYPLYLILGKLWTLFPLGTTAARLNFGTMVYTLGTALFIYQIMIQLVRQPVIAVLTALTFATLPTVWGQSVAAEVYSLHALIIAAVLYVMVRGLTVYQQFNQRQAAVQFSRPVFQIPWIVGSLCFLIGLGLTNHLTTVLVLPALLLFSILIRPLLGRFTQLPDRDRAPLFWVALLSFGLPLLLFFYLPIRWQAVNGEPMGAERFFAWITGSRFQGALQWQSFLTEPERYSIIGRLFLHDWNPVGLLIVGLGIVALCAWRWRYAVLLLVTALAFTFYALNYHVPDLAVFLIPAHLALALFWGTAAGWLGRNRTPSRRIRAITGLLLGGALLFNIGRTWRTLPAPADSPLRAYGEGVLALDLPENATILADSDKFPPLYYLQQAEQLRPDLDIKLLPDEAAYRAELDQQLAANNTVYLARYLPRLPYALRSAGPLVEVEPPVVATTAPIGSLGSIDLVRAQVSAESPYDSTKSAITLEWFASQPIDEALLVYLRWQGLTGTTAPTAGQHPVNNMYPTNTWETNTVIADFHELAQPILPMKVAFNLQVALAPAFTPPSDLEWLTVGAVQFPAARSAETTQPLNGIEIGDQLITGLDVQSDVRPNSPLPVTITGMGNRPAGLSLALRSRAASEGDLSLVSVATLPNPPNDDPGSRQPFAWQTELTAPAENGTYDLIVFYPGAEGRCETLTGTFLACGLQKITVSGATLPTNATNFADQFALLDAEVASPTLVPGGQLDLSLTWLALAATDIDYTVFVQLLDQNETVITQIDRAPLQGTFPTSQWQPAETVVDSYQLSLPADLASGAYRVYIGFYDLRDVRRLPVLNAAGNPIGDKHVITNLRVE